MKPGGVVKIDPAQVATAGAEAYDVLPLEAGLLQLEEQGLIESVKPGVYRIVKPISRFPAGIVGAHSVTFLMSKGVPIPNGNPGTSGVVDPDGTPVIFYDVIRGIGKKPG